MLPLDTDMDHWNVVLVNEVLWAILLSYFSPSALTCRSSIANLMKLQQPQTTKRIFWKICKAEKAAKETVKLLANHSRRISNKSTSLSLMDNLGVNMSCQPCAGPEVQFCWGKCPFLIVPLTCVKQSFKHWFSAATNIKNKKKEKKKQKKQKRREGEPCLTPTYPHKPASHSCCPMLPSRCYQPLHCCPVCAAARTTGGNVQGSVEKGEREWEGEEAPWLCFSVPCCRQNPGLVPPSPTPN